MKVENIGIVEIDTELRLYALTKDNILVHNIDAIKFKLDKQRKNELLILLKLVCHDLVTHGERVLGAYVKKGIVKKIVKNKRASDYNMWEVRSPAHGGRIFFMRDPIGNVIVSAADKGMSLIPKPQDRAINTGVKRWERFLKD